MLPTSLVSTVGVSIDTNATRELFLTTKNTFFLVKGVKHGAWGETFTVLVGHFFHFLLPGVFMTWRGSFVAGFLIAVTDLSLSTRNVAVKREGRGSCAWPSEGWEWIDGSLPGCERSYQHIRICRYVVFITCGGHWIWYKRRVARMEGWFGFEWWFEMVRRQGRWVCVWGVSGG